MVVIGLYSVDVCTGSGTDPVPSSQLMGDGGHEWSGRLSLLSAGPTVTSEATEHLRH